MDSGENRDKAKAPTRPLTRRWLLLAAAASFLAALLAAELLLRVQEPFFRLMQRRSNDTVLTVWDSRWHHTLRPNMVMATYTVDPVRYPKPVIYVSNTLGCRYPRELAVPKPAHLRRVLVLGDSFIEGSYYESTIPARLEEIVNSAPGMRFEVVNCGFTSYSPILHYLRLKHQLLAVEPDEIILNIDLTDIFDDYWRYRPHARFGPDGEPLAVPRDALRVRVKDWVVYRSYLARLLDTARVRLRDRSQIFPGTEGRTVPTERNLFAYFTTLPVTSADWQKEVGFTLANIERIMDLAAQNRVLLTITTHPHKQQLRPDAAGRVWHREFEYRLRALCSKRGVRFFSAFEDIARAVDAGQPVFFENDMHFSPAGEQIWANAMAQYLLPHLRAVTAAAR